MIFQNNNNELRQYWRDNPSPRKFYFGVSLILGDVIVNVCLFFGCRNKSKWLFAPWLIFRALLILGVAILLSGKFVRIFQEEDWSQSGEDDASEGAVWILSFLVLVAFCYLYLATVSYLQIIISADEVQPIRVIPVGPAMYGELPPSYSEKPPDYSEIEQTPLPNGTVQHNLDPFSFLKICKELAKRQIFVPLSFCSVNWQFENLFLNLP